MEKLVELLINNKLTISSCESLTGGLFAEKLVEISGASKVLRGSYISYQDKGKRKLLGLKASIILKQYGAISSQMAKLMAKKIQRKLKTDISVSFTGNAGPIASEGKEVGLVYIGVCIKKNCEIFKFNFSGNRQEIRNLCIIKAKDILLNNIKKYI